MKTSLLWSLVLTLHLLMLSYVRSQDSDPVVATLDLDISKLIPQLLSQVLKKSGTLEVKIKASDFQVKDDNDGAPKPSPPPPPRPKPSVSSPSVLKLSTSVPKPFPSVPKPFPSVLKPSPSVPKPFPSVLKPLPSVPKPPPPGLKTGNPSSNGSKTSNSFVGNAPIGKRNEDDRRKLKELLSQLSNDMNYL